MQKGEDDDTLDQLCYIIAMTTNKSASMLLPAEDSFKQHVLHAQIWCESHIPNPEAVEPVGHGWSACDYGGITQTMFTQAPAPVEVRDLTHLYWIKDCLSGRKCHCLLAGLECIDTCSCTDCENKNCKT